MSQRTDVTHDAIRTLPLWLAFLAEKQGKVEDALNQLRAEETDERQASSISQTPATEPSPSTPAAPMVDPLRARFPGVPTPGPVLVAEAAIPDFDSEPSEVPPESDPEPPADPQQELELHQRLEACLREPEPCESEPCEPDEPEEFRAVTPCTNPVTPGPASPDSVPLDTPIETSAPARSSWLAWLEGAADEPSPAALLQTPAVDAAWREWLGVADLETEPGE